MTPPLQNPNAIVGGAATKRSKSEPKIALPKMQMRRMKRQSRSQPIAKTAMKAKPSAGADAGGAADVVAGVLRALARGGQPQPAVLVGYDWGAGVALAMAASERHRHLVGAVVATHPAFALLGGGAARDDFVGRVRAPVTIL